MRSMFYFVIPKDFVFIILNPTEMATFDDLLIFQTLSSYCWESTTITVCSVIFN